MNKWTDEEVKLLESHWFTYSAKKLSGILLRSELSIYKKAFKLKLKSNKSVCKSKYSKSENFFKNPLNAYWAGFIAADGHLSNTGNRKGVCIALSVKDICLIEEFVKQCKFDGKIFVKNQKCIVNINNTSVWHEDLKTLYNLEYAPGKLSKTYTLGPPNITNQEDIYRYIIGLIDGDGWCSTFKNHLYFGLCGTFDIVDWTRNELLKLENNKYKLPKITQNLKNRECYKIQYCCTRAKNLYEILSKIETPYKLNRKWCHLT